MSTKTIRLYLDNVSFKDECLGAFVPERRHNENFQYYRFTAQVSSEQLKTVKEAVRRFMGEEGAHKPFEFVYNPNDARCEEQQEIEAYFEQYGCHYTPDRNGHAPPRFPMDCVTSIEELGLIYFQQFDPPRVNAPDYTNFRGRTGNIQYHLQSSETGKVYAHADYINLDDEEEDDYIPSGLDDGGIF